MHHFGSAFRHRALPNRSRQGMRWYPFNFHVSLRAHSRALRTEWILHMTIIVRCTALEMCYPGSTSCVLHDLDLNVEAGEFIAILGRSGSGKSTLLNLLGAMDKPTSGTLEVAGVDLTRIDEATQTGFRRRYVGFVFQNFNLVPVLNVRRNLCLPLELNRIQDSGQVPALLDALGLTGYGERYPEQLSGGEQQRVAIGRALIHRPPLILADEPTGNLDLETSGTVLELLRGLTRANQSTVVMATHSLEAAGYADRVLRLVGGKVVEAT